MKRDPPESPLKVNTKKNHLRNGLGGNVVVISCPFISDLFRRQCQTPLDFDLQAKKMRSWDNVWCRVNVNYFDDQMT
ncbi:hypothetical protein Bpfe_010996 [Biomphalaria pfeifferi]|uniref:Uncharacterized protein n=1 Tax=Biomphalaria pfeifferi TaxID=112525 RepID=A0AAD8BTG7_BIOPF|nr:hypothetical protein Bpfe_010996 [Biomphalaria pfeifferi]